MGQDWTLALATFVNRNVHTCVRVQENANHSYAFYRSAVVFSSISRHIMDFSLPTALLFGHPVNARSGNGCHESSTVGHFVSNFSLWAEHLSSVTDLICRCYLVPCSHR